MCFAIQFHEHVKRRFRIFHQTRQFEASVSEICPLNKHLPVTFMQNHIWSPNNTQTIIMGLSISAPKIAVSIRAVIDKRQGHLTDSLDSSGSHSSGRQSSTSSRDCYKSTSTWGYYFHYDYMTSASTTEPPSRPNRSHSPRTQDSTDHCIYSLVFVWDVFYIQYYISV